jgi:hypothetical protein
MGHSFLYARQNTGFLWHTAVRPLSRRDLSVKGGTSERCYCTRRGRTDEQRYAIISPYFDGRIKMNGPYLGINIGKFLSGEIIINNIIKKVNSRLKFLYRQERSLSENARKPWAVCHNKPVFWRAYKNEWPISWNYEYTIFGQIIFQNFHQFKAFVGLSDCRTIGPSDYRTVGIYLWHTLYW